MYNYNRPKNNGTNTRLFLSAIMGSINLIRLNKKTIIKFFITFILLTGAMYFSWLCTLASSILYGSILSPIVILSCSIISLLLAALFFSKPLMRYRCYRELQRAGVVNRFGEAPIIIDTLNCESKNELTIIFDSRGISLSDWNDKKDSIASALNIYITGIKEHRKRNQIALTCMRFEPLPNFVKWDDFYIPEKQSAYVLGVSYGGSYVYHDFSVIPHLLIGGGTGSGKTLLGKNLIYQILNKREQVFIADFKGGVDFPHAWRNLLVTNRTDTIQTLKFMLGELERRMDMFETLGCDNIDNYNNSEMWKSFINDKRDEFDTNNELLPSCAKINLSPLKRIFFFCDEAAAMLDKTGENKETKNEIDLIIQLLSQIARLGRAFGIHLIMSQQRPSADILPGQIKNNIDCRICGRADDVLSRIILDNTSASDEIPFDSQGRFIMNDGTLFQGFYIDNKYLNSNYPISIGV